MIDERSRILMKRLVERQIHEMKELERQTNLSRRQLDYTLEKINEELEHEAVQKLVIENNRLILKNNTKDQLIDLLVDKSMTKNYVMNASERLKYMYLLLLYNVNEYLSINHFIDAFGVGKTTILNDLKRLAAQLETLDISISYSRKSGYHLSGDEAEIRYFLMKMIILDTAENNTTFIYDYFIQKNQLEDFDKTKKVVQHFCITYNISFVENRLKEFIYTFIFLKQRLYQTETALENKYNQSVLVAMKEFQFSQGLLAEYKIKNYSASIYLCAWILGLSLGDPNPATKDFETIMEIVKRMLIRFETISGIRFSNREAVIHQLYSHFRPAYYRLYFRLPIVNSLHKKIRTEYKDLYNIVEETLKPISSLFDHNVPEDEIAFLTMHFASLCSRFDEYRIPQKVALIVCPNGIGSSSIVYTELKNLFPEFSFLGPVETKGIAALENSYDFIFSTVPNIRLFYTKKPVYVVSPIMNTSEKYRLISDIYSQIGLLNFKLPSVAKILEIVSKHTTITDSLSLENELYDYLIHKQENELREDEGPSLFEITAPDLIQLNVRANNCEEAIRISAAPLLRKEKINRNYIETIIETAKTEGAYMVITKHVALPHARPIDGVNELGISIATLSVPIVFGNKENDPVKYIFCLAATEENRHLNAMAELVQLLDDNHFYQLLDTSKDPKQVYDYLKVKFT